MDPGGGDFTDFVTHRSPVLLRTAYLLCGGDRGAAEDLLQDVLERMFSRWHRINGDPEAYARAALANAAANRWRRRSRRVPETSLTDGVQPPVGGHEQGVVDRDQVVRALAALPPRMRAVLVLRFFNDLTEAQTATALRCGVGTVKSQTSRGLARLRETLVDRPAPPAQPAHQHPAPPPAAPGQAESGAAPATPREPRPRAVRPHHVRRR
ncbi:SigE family RNA polymerase sigma factor [Goodfellowiella coeruleoviolacea]|uniref:RNA polymerase sigma-70 factor, sigma-E family n=1 Tax=Goodfellowiella coeruleoviolacea TaxID=334858 RepID=A0AAE3GF28_9PSEU|nr:SigE family RNA polymerase sigma factor [Goodfellowiella coeruleoviolacea]MCP2166945.1 RNA polymerase sigma-70 factor, sigma-E family [Goodfellowiella coeruleoviolacea]